MKTVLMGVGLVLAMQSASAAVQYDFHQVTSSDVENMASTNFTGRAIIDGERYRVDFLTGNAYTGWYLISNNGSRTMTWVDPAKKAYLEVNAASVTSALGTVKMTITNKKVDLTQLEDHPIIAGLPTDHYRLAITYDITLSLGALAIPQSVSTIEDKFVTNAFGNVAETFLASGALKTGNPEIDDLIDTENTKVKGFALKQVIVTTTTNNNHQVAGSPLKVHRTLTTTREITVTAIEPKASVPTAMFMVPAGFHKADTLKDDSQKTPFHVLSMEPPATK